MSPATPAPRIGGVQQYRLVILRKGERAALRECLPPERALRVMERLELHGHIVLAYGVGDELLTVGEIRGALL